MKILELHVDLDLDRGMHNEIILGLFAPVHTSDICLDLYKYVNPIDFGTLNTNV